MAEQRRTTRKRTSTTGTTRPKTAPAPEPEAVRRRAYEIYLGRNEMPGDPVADWLQAERELTSPKRRTRATAKSRAR